MVLPTDCAQADVFEVFLTLQAGRSIALLPQELYDCKTALVMDIPAFGVSLRNHDFAMGEHDAGR